MATTYGSPVVRVTASVDYSFVITVDGLAIPVSTARANGTGSVSLSSADVGVVHALTGQTLADAATATLDLTTAFPTAFASIKYFGVFITSTTGRLRIGGAGSNPNKLWFADAGDKADIWPNGPGFQQGNKLAAVTVDGSNKNVLLDNVTGSGAVTYTVVVAGAA